MKTKDIKKYEKDKKNKKVNTKWVSLITILAFIISFALSTLSELVIPNTYLYINIILVLIFILLGIIFDIVGVAVVSSDEKVFNSMASNKIKGAKSAIKLIKSRDKVSSFCNDVIGDICGVISGSCGLAIALKLSRDTNNIFITILVTSIISALIIGGKALGKTLAVNKSDEIVFQFAKIICFFKKEK